jgi:uncharacterized protein (TIGR02246 family)
MSFDPAAIAVIAADYAAAWNSGKPDAVASFFGIDSQIIINNGLPWVGRTAVSEMASDFFADVPDLKLTCDLLRCAGAHVAFVWTFTGHDANTKNPLTIHGWEEWDLDDALKVRLSRGWFDADDYARQVAGD